MTKDKLKELQELSRTVNRSGTNRCSLCNCVSNESIETEIGDYRHHMSFTQDPKFNDSVICITCAEVIEDQRQDYEYLDLNDDYDFDN